MLFRSHTDAALAGNVYIDNMRLLSNPCIFSPTVSATASPTPTRSATFTITDTPGGASRTPTPTPTITNTPTPAPLNSQKVSQFYTWTGQGGYVVATNIDRGQPITVTGVPASSTPVKVFLEFLVYNGEVFSRFCKSNSYSPRHRPAEESKRSTYFRDFSAQGFKLTSKPF